MSCTFNYIEDKHRVSNSAYADALTEKTLAVWQELNSSNLFDVKDNKLVMDSENSELRLAQEFFIEDKNNQHEGLISVNDGVISVNGLAFEGAINDANNMFSNPLYGQDLNTLDFVLTPNEKAGIEAVFEHNSSAELNSFSTTGDFLGGDPKELTSQIHNVINRLENDIIKLNNEKKTEVSNFKKNIINTKITAIREQINDMKNGLTNLKGEIKASEYYPELQQLLKYVEEKVKNYDYKKDNIIELQRLINFLMLLNEKSTINPIYNQGELLVTQYPSEQAELDFEKETLEKIAKDAKALDEILKQNAKLAIKDLLLDSYVSRTKELEELEAYWDGKVTSDDITLADSYTSSPSELRANNGLLPQVAYAEVAKADNHYKYIANKLKDLLKFTVPKAKIALLKAGIIKKDAFGRTHPDWSFFYEKFSNGNFTGGHIQKFAPEFNKAFMAVKTEFFESKKISAALSGLAKILELVDAKNKLHKFLRDETHVIDLTRLSSVLTHYSNGSLADSITGNPLANVNISAINAYEAEIKAIVGDNYFNTLQQKANQLISEYVEGRAELIKGFTDDLITKGIIKPGDALSTYPASVRTAIEDFEKTNSPFILHDRINKEVGSNDGTTTMLNGIIIPRKEKVISQPDNKGGYTYTPTGINTGYYSSVYEQVEGNPPLLEFLKAMEEITDTCHDFLPFDIKNRVDNNFVMGKQNTIRDILLDPSMSMKRKFFPLLNEAYDSFVNIFRAKDSKDKQNEYKVNQSTIEGNTLEVNKRLEAAVANFMLEGNSKTTTYKKGKVNLNLLTDSQLTILLDAKNEIFTDRASAIKMLVASNSTYEIGYKSILRQKILGEVVEEQNKDLPKLLEAYINAVTIFAAKEATIGELLLIKNFQEMIRKPDSLKVRKHAEEQFEDYITRVGLNFNGKQKSIGTKLLTFQEVKIRKKVQELITKLETRVADLKQITSPSTIVLANIKELNSQIEDLKATEESVGSHFWLTHVGHALINVGRKTALAFKYISLTKNVTENLETLNTLAATDTYLNSGHVSEFNLPSMINSWVVRKAMAIAGNKTYVTRQYMTSILFADYDLFQDGSVETKAGRGFERKQLAKESLVSTYAGVKLPDYITQNGILGNKALDTMVQGFSKNPTTGVYDVPTSENLLDVFELVPSPQNPDFLIRKLKKGFDSADNIKNWIEMNGEDYLKFSNAVKKIITETNGNTNPLDGTRAPNNVITGAMMAFKHWMMPIFRNSTTKFSTDSLTNVNTEGWSRSPMAAIPLIIGTFGTMGLLGVYAGLAGGIVYLGINRVVMTKKTGVKQNLGDVAVDMAAILTAGLAKALAVPINTVSSLITRKQAVAMFPLGMDKLLENRVLKANGRDVDAANMKRAAAMMGHFALTLGAYFLAMSVLAKGFKYIDDDDEEFTIAELAERGRLVYLAKLCQQLYESSLSIVNAGNLLKSFTVMPVLNTMQSFYNLADAMLSNNKYYKSGPNAGKKKSVVGTKRILGITWMDNWGKESSPLFRSPFQDMIEEYYYPQLSMINDAEQGLASIRDKKQEIKNAVYANAEKTMTPEVFNSPATREQLRKDIDSIYKNLPEHKYWSDFKKAAKEQAAIIRQQKYNDTLKNK